MSFRSISRPSPASPRFYGLVAHDSYDHSSVKLSAGLRHCGHLLCKGQALNDTHRFRLLLEKTGKEIIRIFYSHDRAIEAQWRNFNQKFMKGLWFKYQVVMPWIVFLRVHAKNIEDASI